MARVLILGAGVMGTAIAVPAADNGHEVTLAGSPLDDAVVAALRAGRAHPKLDAPSTGPITPVRHVEMTAEMAAAADIVLLGVSSAGIPWVIEKLVALGQPIRCLMMVTKGLDVAGPERVRTLPPLLREALAPLGVAPAIVGVAGPSIAREVANRALTAVVFASEDGDAGAACREVFQTEWYRVQRARDLTGAEANAALKNFLTIGVGAAWTREPDAHRDGARQHNAAAAVFAQAAEELAVLTGWLGGAPETAYGLAGVGDLFVTVNAGRNARLGACLAQGQRISEALAGPLHGETVEGVDTGRALGPALRRAWREAPSLRARLPLTAALLAAILEDQPLGLDPSAYWRDEG